MAAGGPQVVMPAALEGRHRLVGPGDRVRMFRCQGPGCPCQRVGAPLSRAVEALLARPAGRR